MEKISVIVPCFNCEKYIEKCIESIVNQTYKNIEIILVDDGSTDGTYKILEKCKNKYDNIVLLKQKNNGVSNARNNALKKATGTLLTFVDADDYLENDMYDKMIKKMINLNVDIISCNYNIVEENEIIKYGCNDGNCVCYDNYQDIMKIFFKQKFSGIAIWNKIFKKEVIHNILFDEMLKHYEDKLFLFFACKNAKKIAIYNISKYNYVKNSNSASSKIFDISYIDIIEAQKIILDNSIGIDEYAQMDLSNTYLALARMMIISKEYKKNKEMYLEYIRNIKHTSYKLIKKMNKKEFIETLCVKINKHLYEFLIMIRKR